MTAGSQPSTRAIAKVFLVIVGLSALLYLLYQVRHTLGLVFISLFLALALGPPVDFFQRRARLPRALSILVVYLIGALVIVGVGLLIVPPIVDNVSGLAKNLPQQLDNLRNAGWVQDLNDRYQVIDRLKEESSSLPSQLGSAATTLQSITFGAFSAVLQLVTVLVMVFLMLLDGPRLVKLGLDQIPRNRHQKLRKLFDDIYRLVSGYVAGNLIISVVAGLSTYVMLEILGVPYAASLAVLMAFLDLIPLVGASIAGALIGVATALLGDFPSDLIVWGIFLIAYQQAENNLVQPIVYRRTVAVHPLLVIVSVLVGSSLLGVLGALLAIPVAAVIQIVIRDLWSESRLGRYSDNYEKVDSPMPGPEPAGST